MPLPPALVDTGPLVAFLVKGDAHHAWAGERFAALRPPLLTCEPVLTEAVHLVTRFGGRATAVMDLVTAGALRVAFDLQAEHTAVRALMHRYRNVPMSLADACLVRMAELHRGSRILTLDSDFRIYRMNARAVVPTLFPP